MPPQSNSSIGATNNRIYEDTIIPISECAAFSDNLHQDTRFAMPFFGGGEERRSSLSGHTLSRASIEAPVGGPAFRQGSGDESFDQARTERDMQIAAKHIRTERPVIA